MNLLCKRLPVWLTGGFALVAWMIALATATVMEGMAGHWGELLTAPRFQTGFLVYSLPFVCLGAVLVGLGRWAPGSGAGVALRLVSVCICFLAFVVAGGFLVTLCDAFVFKLSI